MCTRANGNVRPSPLKPLEFSSCHHSNFFLLSCCPSRHPSRLLDFSSSRLRAFGVPFLLCAGQRFYEFFTEKWSLYDLKMGDEREMLEEWNEEEGEKTKVWKGAATL